MVSAPRPGQLRVIAEDPFGNQIVCHKAHTLSAIAAGGSPDGVLANKTADKQVKLPVAGPWLTGGWILRLLLSMDSADGLDASDSTIQIAVTEASKAERLLTSANIGYTVDFPAATPATNWIELGTGYTVPNNVQFRVGSLSGFTPTVIAIEDDA